MGPEACHADQRAVEPHLECIFGDPNGSTTILLLGDSHARHWLPALARAGEENGWRVISMTKSACSPIAVPIWNPSFERVYTECEEWRDNVFKALEPLAPLDLVVISKSYRYSTELRDVDFNKPIRLGDAWREGAERTFEAALDVAKHVVVLQDTPWSGVDVPSCFASAKSPSDCDVDLSQRAHPDAAHHELERSAANDDVSFADPTPLVCPKVACPMVTDDGLIKYSDRHHLTQTFSRRLGPALAELLRDFLPQPASES